LDFEDHAVFRGMAIQVVRIFEANVLLHPLQAHC